MFLNENILTLSGYARMRFLEPILQNINNNADKLDVLEIGCANGNFLEYIDGRMTSIRTMTGIDLNADLIDQAKQKRFKHPCRLMAADALQVLNGNDKFHVIIMFDVLEHIADDQMFFQNICRCLTENGTLIFAVPAHQWLWSYVDKLVGHYRRYSKMDLTALLQNMKCNEHVIYSMGLLPGLVLPFTARHLKRSKQALQQQREKTVESSVSIIPFWYKQLCMVFKCLFPVFYVFDYLTRSMSIGSQFLVIAHRKPEPGQDDK